MALQKKQPSDMDGVLVVDKPSGPTSHDIVAYVRRKLGKCRVGHLGTLDPMATGVLPLVVGRATRLASLLSAGPKVYEASILIGVTTDTYDVTGSIIADARDGHSDALERQTSHETVLRATENFVGSFMQTPPPFSAKKINGVRAYRLARKKQPIEPPTVEVKVHSLELLSVTTTHIKCRVKCDSGFYMRALAHDLGASLGCGACLESLKRETNGSFTTDQAVTMDNIAKNEAAITENLLPIETLLPDIPTVIVTDQGAKRASHGNALSTRDVVPADPQHKTFVEKKNAPNGGQTAGLIKLYNEDGIFLAIARADEAAFLRPTIVLV